MAADESHTCFFYGTLMSVDILCRVIGRSHDHLEFADALLKNYTRHHVRGVDYPAIVPASIGGTIIGRKLTDDEASVRGTVVRGLSAADLRLLDTFEGDEYGIVDVEVDLLSAWKTAKAPSVPMEQATTAQAKVYVWTASESMLESSLWSFEDFLRDKSHRWIGNGAVEAEYAEVDRRRDMQGKITHRRKGSNGVPAFGHAMLKHFTLDPEYTNLNHGGVGVPPKVVIESRRKWQDRIEAAPDRFFRKEYHEEVKAVRKRCAQFLNCPSDELAFVLNATTGVNVVLRSIRWQTGDHILYFPNAIYGACFNTLKYIQDRYEDITLVPIDIAFPCTHAEILALAEKVILHTKTSLKSGQRLHLGLIDAICSMPGCVMPWQELCALYRKHSILSMVDAAHLMGQMPVDLSQTQHDFWVSNVHKWCFATRSVALLHVPKRNHHLIETFPTSFGYVSSREPKTADMASAYENDFSYTGTQDMGNVLSIPDAFDFRLSCGGERAIVEHNHSLVVLGSEHLAQALGTEVMRAEGNELIAAMANVRLPLDDVPEDQQDKAFAAIYLRLLDDYNISAAAYKYCGKLYIRVAAQIYNEMDDFYKLADALKEIMADRSKFLQGSVGKSYLYAEREEV